MWSNIFKHTAHSYTNYYLDNIFFIYFFILFNITSNIQNILRSLLWLGFLLQYCVKSKLHGCITGCKENSGTPQNLVYLFLYFYAQYIQALNVSFQTKYITFWYLSHSYRNFNFRKLSQASLFTRLILQGGKKEMGHHKI